MTRIIPTKKRWKTIKLGTDERCADDFRASLKEADCNVGYWANNILDKPAFKVSVNKVKVGLVVMSVIELGFKDGATLEAIFTRAKEIGLDLCPPEVGPQLRLQYKNQPKGDSLMIAMEPIIDSEGSPNVFRLDRYYGGRQWLYGYSGKPEDFSSANCHWVFSSRKQSFC